VPDTLNYETPKRPRRRRFQIVGTVIRIHIIASYAAAMIPATRMIDAFITGRTPFNGEFIGGGLVAIGLFPLWVVLGIWFDVINRRITMYTGIYGIALIVCICVVHRRRRMRLIEISN
jgi:hypothetical protein